MSSAAQAGWARRAEATARSSWAGDVDGASNTTSPGRAGFVTGYEGSSPATTSPSISKPMAVVTGSACVVTTPPELVRSGPSRPAVEP